MKKYLLYLLSIFLLIPNILLASDTNQSYIKDYLIDAVILENGDLHVKEIINDVGTFNGLERDINFKSNNEKYDGSDIVFNQIGYLTSYNEKDLLSNFDNYVNPLSNNEEEHDYYTLDKTSSSYKLKLYKKTVDSTIFYIDYIIKDVCIHHNDVGELYWNYIGDDFSSIDHLKIRTRLQSQVSNEELKVWAHGPLKGSISKIKENEMYVGSLAEIDYLKANTPVTVRMTFPKTLISSSNKQRYEDALPNILKEEEKYAKEANEERDKQESQIKKENILIYILGFILLLFCIVPLIIYITIRIKIHKYTKKPKATFNDKYWREIPDMQVAEADIMLNGKLTHRALNATLLDLITRKNIKLIQTEEGIGIELLTSDGFTEDELYLMCGIFKDIANNTKVSFKTLDRISKEKNNENKTKLMEVFTDWRSRIRLKNTARLYNYDNDIDKKYEKTINTIKKSNGILMFILLVLGVFISPVLLLPIILLEFNNILYNGLSLKLIGLDSYSQEYYETKEKLKALKRFLNDFGRFPEKQLIELPLWNKYLVYACLFGITNNVMKEMKINLKDELLKEQLELFTSNYNEIDKTNDESYTRSEKYEEDKIKEHQREFDSDYSTERSSSSGDGGGFSKGGGNGGGGGGARNF